jgi:ferredoxin-type protein NapH
MTSEPRQPETGTGGGPVRKFVMPATFGGKLWVWRYIILRRVSQITLLVLFFGTAHWAWTIADRPLLAGNLSSSEFLGVIPMADPFAALQILLTQSMLESKVLIGALLILVVYAIIGGRTFCSWVCPVNMVTDLAGWLRTRLGVSNLFYLSRNTRYTVLVLTLAVSVIAGVAAFEWISPIGMLHRELIYSIGLGWTAVLGVFLLDLFILKHGWCGHLCPLGAFYALLGTRTAQLRIRFDEQTCTHCGECARICPEPQVLNLKHAAQAGMVASGECTNCGRCTPICPEHSLSFDWRVNIAKHKEYPHAGTIKRRAA